MKNNRKINRRRFLMLSAGGLTTAGAAAFLLNSRKFFDTTTPTVIGTQTIPQDAKKLFSRCGTCSKTFYTLLNNEFGCPKINEENASDPLAGGLLNTQNQCGMLWGSALAVGAESYRRHRNNKQALAMAVNGTQHLVNSFKKRTNTVNCREVIGVDISDKIGVAGFMLKSLPGGFSNMLCMNLAGKWAPEAIASAREGLSDEQNDIPQAPMSCASEVVKAMGAGDEEIITVAGLAGGMGLSGNACGALGAAIWMNTLSWCRKNPGQSGYANPDANKIFDAFTTATDSKMLCSKISGKKFKTIGDHTQFIEGGGCGKLIRILAQT